MNKIKVVITGGAGFIGSHVAEYWLRHDAQVHVVDNLRTGYISNIEHLQGIIFHKVIITDRDKIFEILRDCTYVHHLAAFVSVPESFEKSDECFEINVTGLQNILDASKEHGIKKIVLSSSAAVYGDNPVSPKSINLKPSPKSPYAETKLESEKLLDVYFNDCELNSISLRYFNVFGPRQDPKSQYAAAIPIFIAKALRNEPITIYGDGEQTRDFIFVSDVVTANILAATNNLTNGVFNIASGKAISINDILRIVIEETKSKSKIIYADERAGDIKHSLASLDETETNLKFNPKYNLYEGLIETIKYFKDKIEN